MGLSHAARTGHRDVLRGHDNRVRALALSPDGHLIATCSDDRTIRVWNRATGAVDVLLGHDAPVRSVAFSPDGRLLASASDDRTVRLWRVTQPSVPRDHDELWRWMSNETDVVQ